MVGIMSPRRGPKSTRPEIEVPDVVGLAAADASEILTRAGLSPCGPEGSLAPTTGTVTAQRPAPTALASSGTTVVLHTETGRRPPDAGPIPATEPDHAPI